MVFYIYEESLDSLFDFIYKYRSKIKNVEISQRFRPFLMRLKDKEGRYLYDNVDQIKTILGTPIIYDEKIINEKIYINFNED